MSISEYFGTAADHRVAFVERIADLSVDGEIDRFVRRRAIAL